MFLSLKCEINLELFFIDALGSWKISALISIFSHVIFFCVSDKEIFVKSIKMSISVKKRKDGVMVNKLVSQIN